MPKHNGLPSATDVQRLAEIRARLKAAGSEALANAPRVFRDAPGEAIVTYGQQDESLRSFLSNAPADIAWLLDEVERLEERVALLRAEVTDMEG